MMTAKGLALLGVVGVFGCGILSTVQTNGQNSAPQKPGDAARVGVYD
jgi:hypothetical protein